MVVWRSGRQTPGRAPQKLAETDMDMGIVGSAGFLRQTRRELIGFPFFLRHLIIVISSCRDTRLSGKGKNKQAKKRK